MTTIRKFRSSRRYKKSRSRSRGHKKSRSRTSRRYRKSRSRSRGHKKSRTFKLSQKDQKPKPHEELNRSVSDDDYQALREFKTTLLRETQKAKQEDDTEKIRQLRKVSQIYEYV